jgi:hypothetical protein
MEVTKLPPQLQQTPKQKLEAERKELKEKLTLEVESLYQDGAEFYKTQQWTLAKNVFVEVDKLWPNYKLTRNYLESIDQNLSDQQAQKISSKSREEKIKEALDAYR